jgi:hypothetical protein
VPAAAAPCGPTTERTLRAFPAIIPPMVKPDRIEPLRSLRTRAASRLARLVGQPPVGPAANAARELVGAASRLWDRLPGARQRHLKRIASVPLPNLNQLYPDVRKATPRELGLRSVGLDQIGGTAVGGPTQRGSDFLPLPAFRSRNWAGRWQRLRRAVDALVILPPIDVVRYADRYWVSDGHNRVAAALYAGQVEIDANVTEMVRPGDNPSERPANLAAALTGTRSLRAAGQGGRLNTVGDDVVLGVPRRDDAAPSALTTVDRQPAAEPGPAPAPSTLAPGADDGTPGPDPSSGAAADPA